MLSMHEEANRKVGFFVGVGTQSESAMESRTAEKKRALVIGSARTAYFARFDTATLNSLF